MKEWERARLRVVKNEIVVGRDNVFEGAIRKQISWKSWHVLAQQPRTERSPLGAVNEHLTWHTGLLTSPPIVSSPQNVLNTSQQFLSDEKKIWKKISQGDPSSGSIQWACRSRRVDTPEDVRWPLFFFRLFFSSFFLVELVRIFLDWGKRIAFTWRQKPHHFPVLLQFRSNKLKSVIEIMIF